MGVAGGGLNLSVPEEFADHRQPFTQRQCAAGEGMAQVVNSDVVQAGSGTDPSPRVLKIGQRGTVLFTRDDPGVVFGLLNVVQEIGDRFAEMDRLGAGLGVRQAQFVGTEVHIGPFQRHDLAETAAGQHQQADGVDGRLGFRAIGLDVAKRLAEGGDFIGTEEALAFVLGVLLDVEAGVTAIRAQPPDFSQIEHLRQDAEGAVGLVGDVAQLVVQFGDVTALNVRDLAGTELRIDEQLDRPPVFALRRRLATNGDVFGEKAFAQPFHGRGLAGLVDFLGRVATSFGLGNDFVGADAGLISGHRAMRANGDFAQPSPHPGHGEIDLAAAWPHPDTEPAEFVVPVDGFLVAGDNLIDDAFGQSRHR